MAKRAKLNEGETGHKPITSENLKELIAEISDHKAQASEAAGNVGKATQAACERFGLEKTALTFCRRLSDMEEGKRMGVIRASIDYWNKMGFFDQVDAFDDLLETITEIAKRAHNVQPARGGNQLDDALTN